MKYKARYQSSADRYPASICNGDSMKMFFVALEFELDEKPNWLDGFRVKYDGHFNYHLTLKYTTLVKENDLQVFMNKLAAGEDFIWSSETEKRMNYTNNI